MKIPTRYSEAQPVHHQDLIYFLYTEHIYGCFLESLRRVLNNRLCPKLHRGEKSLQGNPPLSLWHFPAWRHICAGSLFPHHIAAFVCSWLQYYPPLSLSLKQAPSLIWLRGANEVGPAIAENIASRGAKFSDQSVKMEEWRNLFLNLFQKVGVGLLRGANWIQWPGWTRMK